MVCSSRGRRLCQGCCQGCARAGGCCCHESIWKCSGPGRRTASALLEQASFRLPFSAAEGLACLGCRTEPHRYPTMPPWLLFTSSSCSKLLSISDASQMGMHATLWWCMALCFQRLWSRICFGALNSDSRWESFKESYAMYYEV